MTLVDGLLAWLEKTLRPLTDFFRVLWLTGWCTALFAVGAVFFLGNDQGLDLLRRLSETRGGLGAVSHGFFLLGVLAWGLATWYCARLLLTRSFPFTGSDFFERTRGLRIWLPRAGGSLVAFIVAGGFLRVAPSASAGAQAYAPVVAYVALGFVLLAAFWKRRVLLGSRLPGEADSVASSLPQGSRRALLAAFGLSWGLLVLFLVFPVGVATLLGAPAILLFAAASWILFGSIVLTYWPLANRYPTLTLPLVVAAVVMSFWNDNHTIRETGAASEPAPRQPAAEHFRGWLDARLGHAPAARPYPVFVVAAAGGGMRAAYWSASVLGRIADDGGSAWAEHLYALSGVSGGSVGAALHVAQLADARSAPRPASYLDGARHSLANDLLSPVFAYLLFPDLVQRFSPIPLPFTDRARALELAMESAAADARGAASGRFARRFLELWPREAPYAVPALLLNATVVESGRRGVVSNLRLQESAFPDVVDLLEVPLHTQDMPLSTAVHLSARFTYVSPAGTIRTHQGEVWGHVVDGGYFENSGSATAGELMRQMRRVARQLRKEDGRQLSLILVLIRNDPAAPSLCGRGLDVPAPPPPHGYLSDLLSPVRALLSTRVARGRLAEENALDLVQGQHRSETSVQSARCELGCVFEFGLAAGEVDPPLGWSLSARGRLAMDEQLERHAAKFECIRGLLTGEGCANVPPCPART